MNYKITREDGLVSVAFTVDNQEFSNAIKRAYEKTKDKFKLNGFRAGKVPQKIIENMYGASVFYDDAFDIVYRESVKEFFEKEKDIDPLVHPELDNADIKDEGVEFSIKLFVRPSVKLGQYKGVKVEKEKLVVEEKEISEAIDKAREKLARIQNVEDRAVIDGDEVVIDYAGSVDGEFFEGGSATQQTLKIGAKRFIPGFEEQIVGMEKGGERAINVKFPDDYRAEHLKGKDAVFHIKLHSISSKELPEFDESFVKDTSAFNSVEEYRQDVEKKIRERKEQEINMRFENSLLEIIVNNATINLQQGLIESRAEEMLDEFEQRITRQGLKPEDYYKYTSTERDTFKKEYLEDAQKQIRTQFVIEEIIKSEKLELSDEEFDNKLIEVSKSQGKSDLDEYKSKISSRELDRMRRNFVIDKLLDLVKNSAEVVLVDPK